LKGEEKALKACAQTSRIKILELTPDLSLEAADISLKIGLGMADSAIVDRLRNHEDPAAIFTYRALYESVNSRLDHIALLFGKEVSRERMPSVSDTCLPNYRFQKVDRRILS